MLLLVRYILCNLNYSPLKSSVNLLDKAKEILEVYSCSFPGSFKRKLSLSPRKAPYSHACADTSIYQMGAWGTDLGKTEISFEPELREPQCTWASTVWSLLGHSDRYFLRNSCSRSVWFSSEGVFLAHTPEHNFHKHKDATFSLEVCSFPHLKHSLSQGDDPPP